MNITGDADSMRRGAARLRQRAADLRVIIAQLDGAVAGMAYSGPAADRFRAVVAARQQGIGVAVGHLESLADTMTRSALTAEANTGIGWTA